jgi:hypothetical protein
MPASAAKPTGRSFTNPWSPKSSGCRLDTNYTYNEGTEPLDTSDWHANR